MEQDYKSSHVISQKKEEEKTKNFHVCLGTNFQIEILIPLPNLAGTFFLFLNSWLQTI